MTYKIIGEPPGFFGIFQLSILVKTDTVPYIHPGNLIELNTRTEKLIKALEISRQSTDVKLESPCFSVPELSDPKPKNNFSDLENTDFRVKLQG